MKKSNWREDLYAPVAVKKVLKEFIPPAAAVAATSKIVPFTATTKALGTKGFFSTTTGKLTTGHEKLLNRVKSVAGDEERKKRGFKLSYPGHDIGVTRNPQ